MESTEQVLGRGIVRIRRPELRKLLNLKDGENVINISVTNNGTIEILAETYYFDLIDDYTKAPMFTLEGFAERDENKGE